MGDSTYDALHNQSNLWFCPTCGVTNNTELIDSYNVSVSNSYSSLNHNVSLEDYTDLDSTVGSNTVLLVPQEHSTPEARRPTHTAPKPRRTVKVIVVNCRSISKNRDRLAALIDTLKPDIIICSETHLSKTITVPPVLDAYDVEHRDRDTIRKSDAGGGGVLIAARKEYLMTRDYDLEPPNTELMWCKINIQGTKTLHIGAFYRPDVSDTTSLSELDDSLKKIPRTHAILLGGDFNLPNFNWEDGTLKSSSYPDQHEELTTIMHDYGLSQHVTEYTRKDPVHGTENTLDLILTNRPTAVISSSVVPGISDHDTAQIEFDIKPVRVIKKPREIPMYKKANWTGLQSHAETVCSAVINATENASANELWLIFKNGLTEGIKLFIPTRQQKLKVDLPYMTDEIKLLIRRRDRLYDRMKIARKNVSTHMKAERLQSKYKKLKHDVQAKIRSSYWNYIEKVINPEPESRTPSKSFWSMVKGLRTDCVGISALKNSQSGQLTTDAVGKANALNEQFQSVFTQETPLTPEHVTPQEYPSIPDLTFTVAGVEKLLQNLKPEKASGPDNLSPRVLQKLSSTIAPALTKIYNTSYTSGCVPDDWRHANVMPAYKKGKKTLPVNYRPISLTCISGKQFEHCVTKHIMKHCDAHSILYPLQHGFRSQLSCETQLTEFFQDIVTNAKDGNQTDVLVMDFSKAFDKVGHMRLIQKLDRYGINGTTAQWVKNWLADRTQTVVVDGEVSNSAPVTSGVPQGSVLGPCLFLLYINDLAESLDSTVRLFADDTIAYLAIKSNADAAVLQRDLDKLGEWETKWQMEFHPDKCEVLRISKKWKSNTLQPNYVLRGHELKVVSQAKYLGVTISGDLRWNTHITNITNKANATLAVLKRNVRTSSKTLKETAYKSLVRPQMEYCSPLWDPHQANLKSKIENVQRRSARWVFNKYHHGPRYPNAMTPTEMIQQLQWTSMETRRRWARLVLVYKMLNNMVNMSYRSLLIRYPYHTTDMPLGSITPLSLTAAPLYYNMSFFPRGVDDWNSLLRIQPTLAAPAGPNAAEAIKAFKASVMAVVV